jgi:hypothetical protein
MRIFNLLIALTILLFFCISLNAGVYIESVDQSNANETDTTKLFIEKDRIRVEAGGKSENMITIFRGDLGLFWIINMDNMTYNEVTREDLEKSRKKMDEAFEKMEEQFKNMTPEQKEMMQKMMPSQAEMGMSKLPKTIYKKKASGVEVNQWSCTHYEGFQEGKKTTDVWTTDFNQLGISAADLQGLHAMGKFFETFTKETDELYMIGSEDYAKEGGFSGMPIKIVDYDNGRIDSTTKMNVIQSKSFKTVTFELSTDLTKEKGAWGL